MENSGYGAAVQMGFFFFFKLYSIHIVWIIQCLLFMLAAACLFSLQAAQSGLLTVCCSLLWCEV